MLLYVAALFFVLTPGVLVSLPPKAGKLTVAVTHAVVFAVVYELTHKFVWRALEGFEEFKRKGEVCTTNSVCKSNECLMNGKYGRCV